MLKITHIDIGGCEGCTVSLLRASRLLEDCEFNSIVMARDEFKIGGEDIIIITGAICINDEEKMKMMEELKSRNCTIIAFGSCACVGGITRYCRGEQQPKPEHMTFQPVNSVINVDYAIPGCPPAPRILKPFIQAYEAKKSTNPIQIFKSVAKVKKLSGYDLMDDVVLQNLCVGCGACVLSCPNNALQMINKKPDLIAEKCIRCGTCYVRCPRASQILIRGV